MPTILIVEDTEINREILRFLLENTGFNTIFAKNGRTAVEIFSAEPEKFDIILTDLSMPEMNGYEEARAIRSMGGKGSEIPIIAVTANKTEKDIEKCLAAGMNDHIRKPVDAEELMTKLMKYLK